MREHQYFDEKRWNKTDNTYTFESGSIMEFFSADNEGKVKGPRRHRLFLNEANHVEYAIYDMLEVRTEQVIFLDWNPSVEFWFYDKVKGRPDVDFLILTYRDNEGIPAAIRETIEARRYNKSWWQVYGEGQLGNVEGLIYPNWKVIPDVPDGARLERRGLDFGYTNDPTALLDIWHWNGGYVLDEQLYQRGMKNSKIADFIQQLPEPQTLIIADSAEPKSIDEMKEYGLNIIGATKGPGSVDQGIQFLQGLNIWVTRRSVFTIKEQRKYIWLVDRRTGKTLNVEDPKCENHSMSAARYGLQNLRPPEKEEADDVEEPETRGPWQDDIGI